LNPPKTTRKEFLTLLDEQPTSTREDQSSERRTFRTDIEDVLTSPKNIIIVEQEKYKRIKRSGLRNLNMPVAPVYTSKVKVLDKYHIVGFISSGTYGRVYKARSKLPNVTGEFAIKKFVHLIPISRIPNL
jgi:hypothetical protein